MLGWTQREWFSSSSSSSLSGSYQCSQLHQRRRPRRSPLLLRFGTDPRAQARTAGSKSCWCLCISTRGRAGRSCWRATSSVNQTASCSELFWQCLRMQSAKWSYGYPQDWLTSWPGLKTPPTKKDRLIWKDSCRTSRHHSSAFCCAKSSNSHSRR